MNVERSEKVWVEEGGNAYNEGGVCFGDSEIFILVQLRKIRPKNVVFRVTPKEKLKGGGSENILIFHKILYWSQLDTQKTFRKKMPKTKKNMLRSGLV